MTCSVELVELLFSKMLKLDEKESLEPKMSDFEWLGEVFNFSMFNMFSWLYHIFLISEGDSYPILMFEYSLTILHLFDNLTSFFNLNHLSPSQGYFI